MFVAVTGPVISRLHTHAPWCGGSAVSLVARCVDWLRDAGGSGDQGKEQGPARPGPGTCLPGVSATRLSCRRRDTGCPGFFPRASGRDSGRVPTNHVVIPGGRAEARGRKRPLVSAFCLKRSLALHIPQVFSERRDTYLRSQPNLKLHCLRTESLQRKQFGYWHETTGRWRVEKPLVKVEGNGFGRYGYLCKGSSSSYHPFLIKPESVVLLEGAAAVWTEDTSVQEAGKPATCILPANIHSSFL
ncbi:uncharacterized protein LOC109498771 [Felis catus]|uniref:uncharacterized protein LOC109498771 n=1 Tax=Felis catus TaxID=9685 RepID=UPI001D199943|nr:uncharacterized protein LOC109498771 [Felis catus]